MLGQKVESSTSKTDNRTRGNKPEGTGERMKTKNLSRQGKTIQTKQDIKKERKKKFCQLPENIQTTG